MDAVSLIGNAKDAYAVSLQKQAAAGADALQGAGRRGPALSQGQTNQKKVRDTAQQFEGFFISQMMEHMMAGIEPDDNFGGGLGEETWRSMLNQEYGKQIAKTGKLGIADNVMKAMLRAQEERTTGGNPVSAPSSQDSEVTGVESQAVAAAAVPVRR